MRDAAQSVWAMASTRKECDNSAIQSFLTGTMFANTTWLTNEINWRIHSLAGSNSLSSSPEMRRHLEALLECHPDETIHNMHPFLCSMIDKSPHILADWFFLFPDHFVDGVLKYAGEHYKDPDCDWLQVVRDVTTFRNVVTRKPVDEIFDLWEDGVFRPSRAQIDFYKMRGWDDGVKVLQPLIHARAPPDESRAIRVQRWANRVCVMESRTVLVETILSRQLYEVARAFHKTKSRIMQWWFKRRFQMLLNLHPAKDIQHLRSHLSMLLWIVPDGVADMLDCYLWPFDFAERALDVAVKHRHLPGVQWAEFVRDLSNCPCFAYCSEDAYERARHVFPCLDATRARQKTRLLHEKDKA